MLVQRSTFPCLSEGRGDGRQPLGQHHNCGDEHQPPGQHHLHGARCLTQGSITPVGTGIRIQRGWESSILHAEEPRSSGWFVAAHVGSVLLLPACPCSMELAVPGVLCLVPWLQTEEGVGASRQELGQKQCIEAMDAKCHPLPRQPLRTMHNSPRICTEQTPRTHSAPGVRQQLTLCPCQGGTFEWHLL